MRRANRVKPPPPGSSPDRDLPLVEDSRLSCGEAHVARQGQLVAAAAGPALDHRNRRLGHGAEGLAHVGPGTPGPVYIGAFGGHLLDARSIEVSNEEPRNRAAQHDHANVIVGRDFICHSFDLREESPVKEVNRWVIDENRGDTIGHFDPQTGVAFVAHSRSLPLTTFTVCSDVVRWLVTLSPRRVTLAAGYLFGQGRHLVHGSIDARSTQRDLSQEARPVPA